MHARYASVFWACLLVVQSECLHDAFGRQQMLSKLHPYVRPDKEPVVPKYLLRSIEQTVILSDCGEMEDFLRGACHKFSG